MDGSWGEGGFGAGSGQAAEMTRVRPGARRPNTGWGRRWARQGLFKATT